MISRLFFRPFAILALILGLMLIIPGFRPTFAGEPPLVLAFYYAWYDQNTWASGLSADQPAQPYSSSDPAAIAQHVSQAQGAGIDALIQSWYGPQVLNNQTETNFRALLDLAAARGFHAAVDFETTGPFFPDKASVLDGLRYLLSVHTQHPGYLYYQGKPVVFFWRQNRFSVDEWAEIRAQVDPIRQSLWIAEGVDTSFQAVFDGHHLYSIAWSADVDQTLADWGFRVRRYEAQHTVDRLWVAPVMPGYDDTRTDRTDAFSVARQGGAYYRETWAAAVDSQPDWIIITSFNEWIEGTAIEPSQTYGELYLNLTQELARAFKSGINAPTAEGQERQERAVRIPESVLVSQVAETPSPTPGLAFVRAEEAVRVRAGPGTDYQSIGRLWPGETAVVVGQSRDSSWWQIELTEDAEGSGWVSAEFVTFEGDPSSVPVITDIVSTPLPAESPRPDSTPTLPPTQTPLPTQTPSSIAFSPTPSPIARNTSPPVPTTAPTPSPNSVPVLTPSPDGSQITPQAPTSTPVIRTTPVVQRRATGLLWIGSGALTVGAGLGLLLLRRIRNSRRP